MSKIYIVLMLCFQLSMYGQDVEIKGKVHSDGKPVPFANILISDSNKGASADAYGEFSLKLPEGPVRLIVQAIGFKKKEIGFHTENYLNSELDIELMRKNEMLDQVVVTGTRTAKRQTNSPVIVNLINQKTLDQVVATDLSEGLRFQPGLRVEKDCQTCNYTQIRMNGLQGGYSQVLINGRPIFSPLTGLYGLEQIPPNMIERIEVVRGGISALYGSSAIGGTVNVITSTPKQNGYNIKYTYESTRGVAHQNIITGNATVVSENYNSGASFYFSKREREAFDANQDNFSELPELNGNSFGATAYMLPSEDSKITLSLNHLYEYRYGGEIVEQPAHLAQQSEERTHNVITGNLDYELNFNDGKNLLILYLGGQGTDRKHFTGIIPDDQEEIEDYITQPPYGTSQVTTFQSGFQLNNTFKKFLKGSAILTIGSEVIYDEVFDEIKTYNYLTDQVTKTYGAFLQNDWNISPSLNILSGIRIDKHSMVPNPILSPRFSVLYKFKETTQFRLGWGTGFRAPQAFDADLHIAFAGGGISRISLSETLSEERSDSFTASINFDKANEHFIGGFTLEGFYTYLEDAFYLHPLPEDNFGERFEKRNGSGATVQGLTLEARANFDYLVEFDAGLTLQSSQYDKPVENIDGLPPKKNFLRTPNTYGYATLIFSPGKKFKASANLVYTGSMELVHLGGDGTGQTSDEYFSSPSFTELSLRTGYTSSLEKVGLAIEFFGGIKNITDSYQNDFDIGKNRDSNYIFGPLNPRTYFAGISLKSLNN